MVLLQKSKSFTPILTAMPIPSVLPKISQITYNLKPYDIVFASQKCPAEIWIMSSDLEAQRLLPDGSDILLTHVDPDGSGIMTEMLEVIPKSSAGLKLVPKGENHINRWWQVVPS